jgi:hypothetical protein
VAGTEFILGQSKEKPFRWKFHKTIIQILSLKGSEFQYLSRRFPRFKFGSEPLSWRFSKFITVVLFHAVPYMYGITPFEEFQKAPMVFEDSQHVVWCF